MEKRILVVGATGLLGEPVARQLKKNGFVVRLMVRDVRKAAKHFGDGFELLKGDVTDRASIEQATNGCFGVHINLSGEIEQIGVERIAAAAARMKLQRITYISGTSVAEENTWVPVIKRKFFAEQAIRESSVPYTIFCPTWFMEVLPKYVRGSRAFVFGKQPNPYHLIAAKDYARMVAAAYQTDKAVNKRLILHGPEGILFHEAVKRYCRMIHPEVKKVSTMPYWFASIISAIKGKPELKLASDFMAAFEKIGEWGNPSEANDLLGSPRIRLDDWLNGTIEKGRRGPAVHLSAAQTAT
ncbi:SDR family oxidoreductase [Thermodesulfobacteriota bacterium]